MDTRFCTACNKDRAIVKTDKESEERITNILSCGHRFIEISLHDSVKVHEEFQLRKMGNTNEKYKKGDRPPNINYAIKFFEYGNLDYKAAKILFAIQDQDYDFMNQAAFLCAQAVEKYLKAFLFWNSANHYSGLSGQEILNGFKHLSHDLEKILKECKKDAPELKKFESQIKEINHYSLLKYPDVEDKMVYSNDGLTISSQILVHVQELSDFIRGKIQEK